MRALFYTDSASLRALKSSVGLLYLAAREEDAFSPSMLNDQVASVNV